jgi:EF-P beta-lysylation protein EpmB
MISRTPTRWQTELARAWHEPGALLARLGLTPGDVDLAPEAAGFPLRVPEAFAARMRPGDPRDPLLRQVLPDAAELVEAPGYVADPVDDAGAAVLPGLLHKYRGRALLVATGACAVHCRYCFRRHFPYAEARPTEAHLEAVQGHLAADPSLREVILSGGDPLMLPDARLAALAESLAGIPHLRRLRLHTRLPVVLPARVDGALLAWLRASPLQVVVVLHANHPAELDDAVGGAAEALRSTGALLFNQAVLLRGVNDDVDVQEALCERLGALGVMPYYVHQLDPVAGAAHFAVGDDAARALEVALRARLPGYLVPRVVREVPGAPGKLPLEAAPWD